MVISMKFSLVKHDVMCSKIIGNLKFKASATMGKLFLVATDLYAIYFHYYNTSNLLSYIKEDYYEI
jgi:hypothetical protein